MANDSPKTVYDDWQEPRKAGFVEAAELAKIFTIIASVYHESNPTIAQLDKLKEAYDKLHDASTGKDSCAIGSGFTRNA